VLTEADQRISDERVYDSVNILLSFQNADGGWATYENQRGPGYLEVLNASEVFDKLMVDYTYVECSSSALQGLINFRKQYPKHRAQEIQYVVFFLGFYCLDFFADMTGFSCFAVARSRLAPRSFARFSVRTARGWVRGPFAFATPLGSVSTDWWRPANRGIHRPCARRASSCCLSSTPTVVGASRTWFVLNVYRWHLLFIFFITFFTFNTELRSIRVRSARAFSDRSHRMGVVGSAGRRMARP
jgi:hypothetical protein